MKLTRAQLLVLTGGKGEPRVDREPRQSDVFPAIEARLDRIEAALANMPAPVVSVTRSDGYDASSLMARIGRVEEAVQAMRSELSGLQGQTAEFVFDIERGADGIKCVKAKRLGTPKLKSTIYEKTT